MCEMLQNTLKTLLLMLLLAMVKPQLNTRSPQWIDICNNSNGYYCCAEVGMMDHQYWVMTEMKTWNELEITCLLESLGSGYETRLAVLESPRENDCLVGYLVDRYKDITRNYAIGLKADNYRNVYEWKHVDNSSPHLDQATPAFNNWDPTARGRGDCVYISVGEEDWFSGLWKSGECDTSLFIGICERVLL
eukprot:GFUD01033361.1.p1 GENE.GFUD01033361.1~~GFUD01033361.1.p1  ORF type:complete len:191 (+),score=47.28 GFUD01033361.1:24-596(+)